MSTRGINFLDEWIRNNVPETAKADVISVDELTHKLIADAKAVGIKRVEIDEEVDSLYLACCRFRGHRDKVFNGTGEWKCKEGSSAASSSLRQ